MNATTVLVAIIGAVTTVIGSYLTYRTHKQDQTLGRIEVNVNSRLDKLIDQAKLDNIELGELRSNGGGDDEPETMPGEADPVV